jgi:hypothetical protein
MKIETVEEEKLDENKGLTPNNDNGYDFETYKWTQNAKDLSLYIPIPENIKGKDIIIDFNPTKILVGIKGSQPIFDGELFSIIKTDNCTWLINSDDGKRELVVELDKKKFDEWWPCVMKGDQEIDLSKVRPPNANISDLDQETRATINKMMFEQQEKEKNGFYKDRM